MTENKPRKAIWADEEAKKIVRNKAFRAELKKTLNLPFAPKNEGDVIKALFQFYQKYYKTVLRDGNPKKV